MWPNGGEQENSWCQYIPFIFRVTGSLAALLGTLTFVSPGWGRGKQRSDLPLADLSVTQSSVDVSSWGTPSVATCLYLEIYWVYCIPRLRCLFLAAMRLRL